MPTEGGSKNTLEKTTMAEMIIPDAIEVDVSDRAPPTADLVTLTVTVHPPDGGAHVYSSAQADPVRFNGPSETKDFPLVPLSGSKLYVQLIQGARTLDCMVVGYNDPR